MEGNGRASRRATGERQSAGITSNRHNLRSTLRSAARLPWRLVYDGYRAAVPYERRVVLWTWRRRQTFYLRMLSESMRWGLVRDLQAELRVILAESADARGIVIFPPSAAWNTNLFQRPHQMALAFAAQGYLVLFWVEEIEQHDPSARFRKVADRLYLCRVPPAVLRVCERPIVISYTHNYNWVTVLRSPVIIYELIDHLDIFSDYPRRMLERYHRRLLKRAAVVVGTADDLVAELRPYRPDAILCPNGVDLAHFAGVDAVPGAEHEVPEDMQVIVRRGQPIIGYYGALAEWFDFDLVKYAAEALPDYQFVLIGPDYDGQTMRKAGIETHANICWLGPKRYAELPRYLACFDVATIPFKVTDALQAVSPIKLFEYMAGGRPIVTTNLVECRKYPIVRFAHNADEWVERLREATALRHDAAYLAELRRTAEVNTWAARAQVEIEAIAARAPHVLRNGRVTLAAPALDVQS